MKGGQGLLFGELEVAALQKHFSLLEGMGGLEHFVHLLRFVGRVARAQRLVVGFARRRIAQHLTGLAQAREHARDLLFQVGDFGPHAIGVPLLGEREEGALNHRRGRVFGHGQHLVVRTDDRS